MLNTIIERIKFLTTEFEKEKNTIFSLNESLENAKNRFSQIQGHINEAGYLKLEIENSMKIQQLEGMQNVKSTEHLVDDASC